MKFNLLLRETQFHGGRRLTEKPFRWWWSLGLLLLFLTAVSVIIVTIHRFLTNPTYLVKEEFVENIRDFPSVIVCPEVLFLRRKIDDFLKNMTIPLNLNTSYIKRTINQLAAFYAPDVLYKSHDLANLEHFLEYNEMDLETAAQLLTTTCEETFIRCRWQGRFFNCSELFMMALTGDGYCCVFNGRSLKRPIRNEELEKNYTTRFAGFTSGLMLAINQSQKPVNVDLTYKWLALQSSRHFVESSINGTPLNPGFEQWAALHIENFQIAEDARSLSQDLKRCRMRTDRLEYFPLYHRRYCVLECEMHRTLEMCNCVRHTHPLPKGAKFCRANMLLCTKHAKVPYDSPFCDCPLACDVANDYVTTSSFKLVQGSQPLDTFYAFIANVGFSRGLRLDRVTIVRAFLKSRKQPTSYRQSYFTKLHLFAQLGGTFSLFFGCSILSLLELAFLAFHWLRQWMPKNTIKTDQEAKTDIKKIKKVVKKGKKKKRFIKTIS